MKPLTEVNLNELRRHRADIKAEIDKLRDKEGPVGIAFLEVLLHKVDVLVTAVEKAQGALSRYDALSANLAKPPAPT